jgi:hypothetical protein
MRLFLVKKTVLKMAVLFLLLAGALLVSCEQPAGIVLDGDATLKSLTLDAGTLSPAFSSLRFEYTATVRYKVDLITVSAETNNGKAAINGTGARTLAEGNNTVTVRVKAENGDSKTYTITVRRLDASVREIETAEDMAKIGVEEGWSLASEYTLINDITLENWNSIIGSNDTPFSGIFEGNGKTITLKSFGSPVGNSSIIPVPTTTINPGPTNLNNVFLGIFGYVKGAVSVKAEIKDLTIISSVDAVSNSANGLSFGLLTGYAEQAVIENINLSGTFDFSSQSGKTAYVGGVAGIIIGDGTVVKNCNSSMDMDIKPGCGAPLVPGLPNPFSWAGGFVGYFMMGAGIENCHNSGDVSAISEAASSQVMVGGIAGGSFYGFSTQYHGYIRDSSSIGDITVGCIHFWPFAGGIAGTVCGGGWEMENKTRIERCFASGTVKVIDVNPNNKMQWPYIGGIVGYVYMGAAVSQCQFDGTVIVNRLNDYSGGIAGYSSNATYIQEAPCVIEDCWSAGEVIGYNNAGGIVGQNQQNTILRRCYSLMDVSVTNNANGHNMSAQWGVGGIAGLHLSTIHENAMLACVALNSRIFAPLGNEIHRIAGRTPEANSVMPKMTNNYALPDLLPVTDDPDKTYTADKGTDKPDGADIPNNYLSDGKPTQAFYVSIGWDFVNVWKMGSDGYPKLKWQ